MSWTIPVPTSVVRLVKHNTHPGLLLDKYAASWNEHPGNEKFSEMVQRKTIDRVVMLSQSPPNGFDYTSLFTRHQQSRPQAEVFRATTIGPLTLHLSRASALENAGICLHPIYGFVYLPGSGLKGMAHAYACEVWLPAQSDRDAGWKAICDVFGAAPSPWLGALARRLKVTSPKEARAGAVVFHDAWSTAWPKLITDIVNNHHPKYYEQGESPGDWENPVPVNFLAVSDGTQFEFTLSPRRPDRLTATPTACARAVSDVDTSSAPTPMGLGLNGLATQWLAGALTHLGAGAKTAAGYGAFRIDSPPLAQPTLVADVNTTWSSAVRSKTRAEFSCTLELITPAFLAGAKQQADDCDLRPATLRGQLRWWWRTLHAAHVDTATLRKMEAAVWGDTKQGGAVRIMLRGDDSTPHSVVPCPLKKPAKTPSGDDKLDFDDGFAKQHDIPVAFGKTTQPVLYLSYGMDELVKEHGAKIRRRRHCLLPGAKWNLTLTARHVRRENSGGGSGESGQIVLEAGDLLDQAKAALWMFCRLGGVGSKARKGFGSLADVLELADLDLAKCKVLAQAFRKKCHAVSNSVKQPSSATIEAMQSLGTSLIQADCLEIPTVWKNSWLLLDQIGASLQSFAQADASTGHGKHCESKTALGLPRQIHGPRPKPLPHQNTHTPPKRLLGPQGDRHPAPVHFHVARDAQGQLCVRVAAFPTSQLPDWTTSERVLGELLQHAQKDLSERAKQLKDKGQSKPTVATAANPTSGKRPANTPVKVKIVAVREKGGFEVQEDGRPNKGVLNLGQVPNPPPTVGDVLDVLIKDDAKPPQYQWKNPVANPQTTSRKPQKKGGKGAK